MPHAKVVVLPRTGSPSTRFDSTRGLTLQVDGWQLFAHCPAGPRSLTSPVVVLVHGLEDSSESMLGVARALAPDHRVYAIDLPGFGRSEGPPEGLDVPVLADALAAWLAAMKLTDVTIAGSSTGCQVVARMAARYPARVARIVLESPTLDPLVRTSVRLLAAWVRNLPHAPLREARRDAIAPGRWAADVAKRLPAGRLQVVPGVAHGVSSLAPRAFAAAVYRFVRDVPERHAA